MTLDVIYEDNHLLVVNKPARLPTMGTKQGDPSLIDAAKNYLKRKYDKPGNVYLGVVSRLDAFVSGVIVLARTSKAASRLNEQFAGGTVNKVYWAMVPDDCPDSAQLEDWLVKDEDRHRMIPIEDRQQPGAKRAVLHFRRIGRSGNLSLLEINLLTGRKHQIRVQLSSRGYPVVGDRKYGSPISFKRGIALHSRSLTIQHPTRKQEMTFECVPPGYWQVERFH